MRFSGLMLKRKPGTTGSRATPIQDWKILAISTDDSMASQLCLGAQDPGCQASNFPCPNEKLLNPDLEGTIFTVPRIPSAWNCLNLPWHPVAVFYPMKAMGARCHRSSVNDVESKLPGYVSGIREWFRWCALSCHCW